MHPQERESRHLMTSKWMRCEMYSIPCFFPFQFLVVPRYLLRRTRYYICICTCCCCCCCCCYVYVWGFSYRSSMRKKKIHVHLTLPSIFHLNHFDLGGKWCCFCLIMFIITSKCWIRFRYCFDNIFCWFIVFSKTHRAR